MNEAKGIGKLSVFSLAREVSVFSRSAGEANGLHISVKALRDSIALKKTYEPEDVPAPDDLPPHGTRIVLSGLNRKRTGVSVTALRRRIARRFDAAPSLSARETQNCCRTSPAFSTSPLPLISAKHTVRCWPQFVESSVPSDYCPATVDAEELNPLCRMPRGGLE
ncbi:hypothetical protein FQ142_08290 [Microbacterium sp. ANT_H45B]|uniref:hypothetical protein n=1 Tax=Microbacterium sp. ANT_H45B TaxID=2597346 RepID=UPI0011F01286|nr:hypothetical protein [Microbacterium sp. ANT_H45B]KAA0960870.1 hypothetical protein FQ142_08290 [Microbacterium sp. ANT_H45B]